MKLPVEFEKKMRRLLQDEFEAYERELSLSAHHGIRFNRLKLSMDRQEELFPHRQYNLLPIPWTKNGYYLGPDSGDFAASKHPLYHAGLYYLQDPSAMAPAQLLPIEPGDRVLDLCAAPGGKSTELGARLQGEGVLVTNDISLKRTKALLKNVELFGLTNAVVLNETPKRLVEHFGTYFDKILVDAPCSGEGMFRKDAAMMKNWEEKGIEFYCDLQREILDASVSMLAPGGMLLYSTCTFSPEEDEANVARLLSLYPELKLVPIEQTELVSKLFDQGHPEWIPEGDEQLKLCARLWPHRLRGEGHFLALFQKSEDAKNVAGTAWQQEEYSSGKKGKKGKKGKNPEMTGRQKQLHEKQLLEQAEQFLTLCTEEFDRTRYDLVPGNENIYLIPRQMPSLKGLHVIRSGLLLGSVQTYQRQSFEPSQAFAMALQKKEFASVYDFGSDYAMASRYLQGESIEADETLEGWVLMLVQGYALGWGKAVHGRIKNKYSKSWRMGV